MDNGTQSILERFDALADAEITEYRRFFRRLRQHFSDEAAEVCLNHTTPAVAKWVSASDSQDSSYVAVLLDQDSMPADAAVRAVSILKDLDLHFFDKFKAATAALDSPSHLLRALSLIPAMGNYHPLMPWLQKLSNHSDVRVRSRAARLFCELRPSKVLIRRQLRSAEARIRADALEVLAAHPKDKKEACALMRAALNDENHRVVANALVGLYNMGQTEVIYEMVALSRHSDHLFRAAMAWAMAFVKDSRAIPALRALSDDPSAVVRKRALIGLRQLETLAEQQDFVPVATVS